jgi:transcriptional regulator GlxA family with amidase domain
VRELQDVLHASLDEAHSLDALARRVDLSPRSLSRRFQAATGRSPMRYLRELRLREARSLLTHSDLGVAEIAWRCGFGSPSRFASVFARDQGMSPREFRAAVRGKRFGRTGSSGRA